MRKNICEFLTTSRLTNTNRLCRYLFLSEKKSSSFLRVQPFMRNMQFCTATSSQEITNDDNVETAVTRRFIFGLGNPGTTYEGTRHNIGFDVVDNIATKFLPVYSLPDETGCKNFDFSYDSNVSSFILERNVKFIEGLSKGFNGKLVDHDLTDSVSERRQKRTKAEGVRYPVVALNLIKPNTYMNRSGKSTFSMSITRCCVV